MEFQDADIEKLAMLSRIKVTEHEREKFRDQLTSVLAYVEQISTATVTGSQTLQTEDSRMRVDTPVQSPATSKEILSSAPHVEEGHISVLSVK